VREYIGHRLKCIVQGFPAPFTGLLVKEDANFLYLKGEKEVWRIPKGKLCGFTPIDAEPLDYVPFHVLYCENKTTNCQGVQYVKEGTGFAQKDVNVFMEPCPCKCETCRQGTRGELKTVSGKVLKKMFSGMLFGDYPVLNKENGNGNSRRSGEEVERTQGEGGGTIEGQEPLDWGIGQSQEETI